MRLAAQRVVSPGGQEGINAFYYLHGPYTWLDEPPAQITNNPGELVNERIVVSPPGNHVRSYLEILAADHTPSRRIARDVLDAVNLLESRPLPLNVRHGDTTFDFNAELRLAAAWRGELEALLWNALAVRTGGR